MLERVRSWEPGWYWGHGDRVSHFYVIDSNPNFIRSRCSQRFTIPVQLGKGKKDDPKCRNCDRKALKVGDGTA